MSPDLDMVLRLGLAFLLGGAIGLERETHSQPAGLRTHMVVAVASALIMLISIRIVDPSRPGDPGRIAAQIVSGIGFLGAGAIIKYGTTIRGLTTAACLWAAAGIGMAAGMGWWKGAVATTGFVLTATFIFDKLEKRFLSESTFKRFRVNSKDAPDLVARVEAVLGRHGIAVKGVGLHQDFTQKTVQIDITGQMPRAVKLEELIRELDAIPEVEKVEVE